MIRRRPLPVLDPKELGLPPEPKVLEIRLEEIQEWTGEEGLRVWVIVEALTEAEEQEFGWTLPIEDAVRKALDEQDEDRWPRFEYRLPTELDEHVPPRQP